MEEGATSPGVGWGREGVEKLEKPGYRLRSSVFGGSEAL